MFLQILNPKDSCVSSDNVYSVLSINIKQRIANIILTMVISLTL